MTATPQRFDDVENVLAFGPPRSRWARIQVAWRVLLNRPGACQIVVNYRENDELHFAVCGVQVQRPGGQS